MNIIIVDDEEQIRDSLSILLKKQGHKVDIAETGNEAVLLCEINEYDLLITDIIMPDMDGVELIIQIKKDYPEMNIIVMSGGGNFGGTENYLQIAKGLGVNKIFNKPVRMDALFEAINEL